MSCDKFRKASGRGAPAIEAGTSFQAAVIDQRTGRRNQGPLPLTTHQLLLVGGQESRNMILRRAFARRGWMVHAFGSTADALEALERGPEPCCVIINDTRLASRRAGEVLEQTASLGYKSRLVILRRHPAGLEEYRPGEIMPRPITADDIWRQVCPVCDPFDDADGPGT